MVSRRPHHPSRGQLGQLPLQIGKAKGVGHRHQLHSVRSERIQYRGQPAYVATETGVVPDQHRVELAALRNHVRQQAGQSVAFHFDSCSLDVPLGYVVAVTVSEPLQNVLLLHQRRDTFEPLGGSPQVGDGTLHWPSDDTRRHSRFTRSTPDSFNSSHFPIIFKTSIVWSALSPVQGATTRENPPMP